MRTITNTNSLAPSSSTTSMTHSSWHSPIPYLFGGLAAMLGLIAFALLILACSYWRLSGQLQDDEENNNRNIENEKEGENSKNESVKVYEEKFLVIMAGDQNPTFLATPVFPKSSSVIDLDAANHSDKQRENHESVEKLEKEEMETEEQSEHQ
ncbi:protein GLUTAMINE DUMPER 5-like [Trifolium pratense]|nr:protein GLUTAMINE DUMPER 5-like [Trifolium pratense]